MYATHPTCCTVRTLEFRFRRRSLRVSCVACRIQCTWGLRAEVWGRKPIVCLTIWMPGLWKLTVCGVFVFVECEKKTSKLELRAKCIHGGLAVLSCGCETLVHFNKSTNLARAAPALSPAFARLRALVPFALVHAHSFLHLTSRALSSSDSSPTGQNPIGRARPARTPHSPPDPKKS